MGSCNLGAEWTCSSPPEVRIRTSEAPSPFKSRSVPGSVLVDLQKLTLDGPHPRHQPVQLGQQESLLLLGCFDTVRGRAVANALESISQLSIQKPHALLQLEKLLV